MTGTLSFAPSLNHGLGAYLGFICIQCKKECCSMFICFFGVDGTEMFVCSRATGSEGNKETMNMKGSCAVTVSTKVWLVCGTVTMKMCAVKQKWTLSGYRYGCDCGELKVVKKRIDHFDYSMTS